MDTPTPTAGDAGGQLGDQQPIFLPGLLTIANLLRAQLAQPQDARLLQAASAPQIAAENQGTLTDAASVTITEARLRSRQFSFAVIVFDASAGNARYSYVGKQTKGGGGFQIPAGGGTFVIYGSDNIANFAMIAETGQTANYTYGLFI